MLRLRDGLITKVLPQFKARCLTTLKELELRSAAEIKRELIILRFTKKIPLVRIARDSRCGIPQVIAAMKLQATELIQRRLDAYLDAGHLHVIDKKTKLLDKIERMTFELRREFEQRSLPMKDVQLLSIDQQQRLANAMDWRLKKCLREKFKAQIGWELLIRDGESYWAAKAKVRRQAEKLDQDRNSNTRKR